MAEQELHAESNAVAIGVREVPRFVPHQHQGTLYRGALLNQGEAARALGCDPSTLRRWRSYHQGPQALRIGKRYYYSRQMLEQWVKALSLA